MNPFFSVVIPLYNKALEISYTLSSVLAQTYTDFEVIVINDGSTDDSLSLVETFNDKRIKVYTTENKGVSHARNFGIKNSSSQVIAFLDGDDLWKPHHLEDLKALFECYPNCGMYCKAYEKIYFSELVVKAIYNDIEDDFEGIVEDYFKNSLIDSIAWTSATAIPKTIFNTYGYFDESLKSGQDTDLWIRIALKETVAFSNVISATRLFSASNNHLSQSSHIKQRIQIIERYQHLELKNKSLKTYLDCNRYSMAVERKLHGDLTSYQNLLNAIDLASLNSKQKFLLKLPTFWIKRFKGLQGFLIKKKIYLSAFR
ncbi:glycosyltransferase family 2 protein [Psychroserpens burtonensis]|uniref:Glycosyltransferase family 2 protein n=1 Tax=Psychroserpens burtonensis TaxID=49278 RepID=A0A5C7BCE6_9FLAO|nr:glycosyltransferase family 2 protein [Psychroserpens burtonensis]TXE15605.1 glycosyltransferase family 2 protein [Psychroserpens burtonensis]